MLKPYINDPLRKMLLSFLVQGLPKDFVEKVKTHVLSKYSAAHWDAVNSIPDGPISRLRAQNRRYYLDQAMVNASREAGINHKLMDADNKGEKYLLIRPTARLTVTHLEVKAGATIRRAKHRKQLARKNFVLEQKNYELFPNNEIFLENFDEALHVIIEVNHPSSLQSQAEPFAISIKIPYSTWDGYHFETTIDEFLGLYEDQELQEYQMPDEAWPKFRKDLVMSEKKDSSTE